MDPVVIGEGLAVATPLAGMAAACAMVRTKAYKSYSSLLAILVVNLLFDLVFLALSVGPLAIDPAYRLAWYLRGYTCAYLLCGILLYFTIQDVIREVMLPLPGLNRLGLLAFRWVVAISIIVAISSSYIPLELAANIWTAISRELMRCISIMELCLLVFVLVIARRLAISFHAQVFGIALGFALISASEIIAGSLASHNHSIFSAISLTVMAVRMLALSVLAIYFWKPQPQRRSVAFPASSPLLRWNEVGLAFSHSSVHPPNPSQSEFFLTDVEQVVDKALIKNSVKATES
jgi:hypothetical protein